MDNYLDISALQLSQVIERHESKRGPVMIEIPCDFPIDYLAEFFAYHGYHIDGRFDSGLTVIQSKMFKNQTD